MRVFAAAPPLRAEIECGDDFALKSDGIDERSHEAREPLRAARILNLTLKAGLVILFLFLIRGLPFPPGGYSRGGHTQRDA